MKTYTPLVIVALAAHPLFLNADSYNATIPGSSTLPLAWSFENSTVSAAFSGAYPGQKIHFWNVGNQAYDVVTYRSAPFNSWSNGSYGLTNGHGFIWENLTTNGFNLTVSGTNIATVAVTNSFSRTNWYLLADPFLRHITNNFPYLECVYNTGTGVADYTTNSFDSGIALNFEDTVHTWVSGAWASGVRETFPCDLTVDPFWRQLNSTNCTPAWANKTSPEIKPGLGFWYYPSTNTTWVIRTNLVNCNP